MKLRHISPIIWIFIGLPFILLGQSQIDSLHYHSVHFLEQAIAEKRDFVKKTTLAQQAIRGFEQLGADSLLIEAKFIVAKCAYYRKDSLGFIQNIEPILQSAMAQKDTHTLVRAFNMKGVFYFSMDDKDRGIEMLKVPDERNYYTAGSIDENIFNLGALVDVSLGYSNHLDSVYYYVNKLQTLANLYPNPSVQVVSRFKMALLFTKASNYEEALTTLKTAYPFLDQIENKGFLHYYLTFRRSKIMMFEKIY